MLQKIFVSLINFSVNGKFRGNNKLVSLKAAKTKADDQKYVSKSKTCIFFLFYGFVVVSVLFQISGSLIDMFQL